MSQQTNCGTDTYLSPNQSKKLLAFGLFAAAASLPLSNAMAILPGPMQSIAGDIVEWVASGFVWAFEQLATIIARAVFGSIGYIFAAGTEQFLFFRPPGQVEAVQAAWFDFLPLFWAILPVAGGVFFLAMQLFPEKEEADIYRFMERSFVAVVALIVTGPVFTYEIGVPGSNDTVALDLLSAGIFAVNEIGLYIFPDSYSMAFMGGFVNAFMGALATVVAGAGVIIAVALVGWKFLIAILLVVGLFWVVLAMRMLLIYTVYAMMPLFLALWVVDIGPMKYGKMVASMIWKITALLLLLGLIIAGILNTTSAIAGQSVNDDVAFTDEYDDQVSDGLVNEDGEVDSSSVENSEEVGGSASTADPPGGLTRAVLQIFAWFGGIVLSIAITTSILGMVISARGASGTSSRVRQGRSPDAPIGPQTFGGVSGGGGGGGGGAGGAAGGAGAAGAAGAGGVMGNVGDGVMTTGDGETAISTDDGAAVMGDDGSMTASTPETPEPDAVPIRDKIGHQASRVTDSVDDATDGAVSDASESLRQTGQDLYDKVPSKVQKAGSLAKRGGSAYMSVFDQPDPMSSMQEMGRIARESPIGHPDAPSERAPEPDAGQAMGEDMAGGEDPVSEDADAFAAGEAGDGSQTDVDLESEGFAAGHGGETTSELGTDASVDELTANPDDFANNERVNLENVEYRETENYVDDPDLADTQRGELVDPNTGKSIQQEGLNNVGDGTPELQDGERYDVSGARVSHSPFEENDTRVHFDEDTSVDTAGSEDTA